MGHTHFCQRLFQLDVDRDGRAQRTGKAAKASKAVKGPLAAEAELAREDSSAGAVEDESGTAAEDKVLDGWVESARQASSASAGAPLVEDVVEESTMGEAEADDPPAPGRRRVLCRASSGEPVRPGRAMPRKQVQEQSVRQTRAAVAKKAVKAAVAKKKATASSSSKRRRTPSPSPPSADVDTEGHGDADQRVAKRAKASTGDKPPVGTSSASSADQENIDTVIEEVARDAEAEADKIATEEAAKTAIEEAAKGHAGEGGRAAAEGGAKAAAEEVAQDLLAERKQELILLKANVEKTQEVAKEQAAKDEAARHKHQAELNCQEEDLAARVAALAATSARLFQLDMDRDGRAERTGKAAKAGKAVKGPLFGLPVGVVPLCSNSCQTDIIAMMPDFNAHGLDPSWVEPEAEQVHDIFDCLSEKDTEMLAQRVEKRAKASTGDKPPAGTSSTPLVVESSPEKKPRRSPRFSPQRESITHSSIDELWGVSL
nr:actin cytoskeleton-regulatory complex protein pan1-like [Aegilops tauschii subsp. strangulata]